jgi:hypothetical protein
MNLRIAAASPQAFEDAASELPQGLANSRNFEATAPDPLTRFMVNARNAQSR